MVASEIGVFICHRAADSADPTRRLHAVLADRLGPAQATLDTDAIDPDAFHPGVDLEAEVEDAVGRSGVFLIVVGPKWLSLLDDAGRRLIDDPADQVRLEIDAAVRRQLRIIWVLVGGADLPLPDELPEALRSLVGQQVIAVWGEQVDVIFRAFGLLVSELLEGKRHVTRGLASRQPAARQPSLAIDDDPHIYVDENVQFTVYRPRTIQPARWSTLLAFAHLAERRPDAPDEADPLDEVRRLAQQLLGEDFDAFADLTQESGLGVPREGEITFLPDAPGVEFNPVSRTFRWLETVHREEFRLRATRAQPGEIIRGQLSVFLGVRLLAEIQLQLRVAESADLPRTVGDHVKDEARPYRRIFASYSHRDVKIAQQFEHYAVIFGDRYLRDWIHLRAGENWSDRLEELIREADVFQLFWSSNSMRSANVRREWEYALSLNRPNFVRPTYWEHPLPRDSALGLPPPALASLHFQRLALEPATTPPQYEHRDVATAVPQRAPVVLPPPATVSESPVLMEQAESFRDQDRSLKNYAEVGAPVAASGFGFVVIAGVVVGLSVLIVLGFVPLWLGIGLSFVLLLVATLAGLLRR